MGLRFGRHSFMLVNNHWHFSYMAAFSMKLIVLIVVTIIVFAALWYLADKEDKDDNDDFKGFGLE